MRLLRCDGPGAFSLTKDFINEDEVPEYAILSHTWQEGEEVTFKDLADGTGLNKNGFNKLVFCAEQAKRDGLEYFWVDTCCINKSNAVELQEAINSMFRWYKNATTCYVYLADVSQASPRAVNASLSHSALGPDFQKSRWFSRGWTLQELLAPDSVEFFSREGFILGDKIALQQEIHSRTGIPLSALEGDPLSQFTVDERLSWAQGRQTTRKEDMVYSLLGIFDIQMPLLYGEGREKAHARLLMEIERAPYRAEEKRKKQAARVVLDNLAFHAMKDRFDNVPDAFQRTFNWVFSPPSAGDFSWSNFDSWLSGGRGIYWINGKAGCGKSTLLKFICNHPRTKQALDSWAGANTLVIARFFFWKGGHSLQKSQLGLLRGLLFETLSQCEPLIPVVLPERFQEVYATLADSLAQGGSSAMPYNPYSLQSWSRQDLEAALTELIQQTLIPVRICFFVDGLDEYDGDHSEIVHLLERLNLFPNFKVCLSSRPWPMYQRAFENQPCLRVQDLTRADIAHYIDTKLGQNKDMNLLLQSEPFRGRRLITDILEKSSGVFLWVTLVVKSLLNGLANSDNISDLEKRLRILPADLEELYRHMIKSIDPHYLPKSSRLFQIMVQFSEPPTTLALSLAIEEDTTLPITAAFRGMPVSKQKRRSIAVDHALRSACFGLLEVDTKPYEFPNDTYVIPRVQFLHRTVLDFFSKPDISLMLQQITNLERFNPNIAILSSVILQLKWLLKNPKNGQVDKSFWRLIQEGLHASNRADKDGRDLGTTLLDELDQIATIYWGMTTVGIPARQSHWTNWIPWEFDTSHVMHNTFLSCMVRYQVTSYLRQKLLQSPNDFQHSNQRPLLDHAIPPVHIVSQSPLPSETPNYQVVALLLSAGADPNQQYMARTPWQNVLSQVCEWRANPFSHSQSDILAQGQKWTQILELLLDHGADINVQVNYQYVDMSSHQCTQLIWIVSHVLSQWDPNGAARLKTLLSTKYRTNQIRASLLPTDQQAQSQLLLPAVPLHNRRSLRSITPKDGVRLNLREASLRGW